MPTSPHPDKTPNTTTPKNKKNVAETTFSSNHLSTTSPHSVARPLDSPTSLPLDRFTAHASHLHQRPVSSRSNSNVIITSTLPTEDHHHHGAHANTGSQGQRAAGPHPHASSSSSSTSSSSSMSVRSFQAQARNVVASWTGFGSTASPVDGPDGNSAGAPNQQQNRPSEMMAIAEARLFTQQLLHQQQDSRTSTGSVTGGRSVLGSMGRGGASTIGGAGSGGHSSPVLGGDEPSEQTLLLTRPLWVQDQDAAACRICARTFNAVRRKHHCRQCGHIFCHDCSSRSIALPQLGYTKAVRVCNDCFEVAYLVAYCLSDDLGTSTQIHGARGLYELIETNDVKVLQSVLDHGGLDAMIYLCGSVHGYELHALATNSLAVLSENQTIQGIIVAKRAMPSLFHLTLVYAQNAASPPRPPSPPMSLIRMASNLSLHTKSTKRIETVVVILINITHIVYQMLPNKLLANQLVKEGAMDSLMSLCVYFPSGVRSRAMEKAIRSVAQEHARDGSDNTEYQQEGEDFNRSPSPSGAVDDGEPGLIAMDDMYHVRLESMQGVAAKCISVMAAEVANQSFIVDDPERIDRLVQLLYSNNADVVKYASKTMAYLSLRNDKYKPDIVKGSGASALLSVIRMATGEHFQLEARQGASQAYSEAVSHACCALANLATNTESQEILMSQLDLVNTACSVVGVFPNQREVERHVARLIANLALYDQNKLSLLTAYTSTDGIEVSPQLAHHTVPHRYSSPPPGRRAKGNVIPTLLMIGKLTLEWAGNPEEQEADRAYPFHGQDVIDFMNDDDTRFDNPGYLTPNDSSSETDASHDGGEIDQDKGGELLEWVTIRGMEDVQRHIIRAIDNLMTLVMEDPASHQSFKVFSRIWPTLGLIKAIQMANQDEDTQRRATHVLTTLIQQQQIHAETIPAMKEQMETEESKVDHVQEREQKIREEAHKLEEAEKAKEEEKAKRLQEEQEATRAKEEEEAKAAKAKEEEAKAAKAKKEEAEASRARAEEEAKAIAQAKAKELARAERERLVREAIKLKFAEQEKEKQEKLRREQLAAEEEERQKIEQEKAAKEQRKLERRAERERLERERLEQESLEQERLEQKKLEKERIKKERREQERLEKERLERERLEQERLENERLEQEQLEKERLEEEERLEQERIKKERKEAARLEQERLEQERLEQELEQERLEQEHLKYQRLEEERIAKEMELEQKKREKVTLAELADQSSPLASSSRFSEEMLRSSSSKTLSSSEDLSVDESPRPVEKASKKTKKKKGRK
ncbi:MAG: hypothetical protein BYD32DRAFT_410847 [Podila humilis]|nr:MAG: hypothetical protein BYD32DRAFT_410847 [Podila humilis]